MLSEEEMAAALWNLVAETGIRADTEERALAGMAVNGLPTSETAFVIDLVDGTKFLVSVVMLEEGE